MKQYMADGAAPEVQEATPQADEASRSLSSLQTFQVQEWELQGTAEIAEITDIVKLPPSDAFHAIDAFLAKLFDRYLASDLPSDSPHRKAAHDIFANNDWKGVKPQSPEDIAFLRIYANMQHLRGFLIQQYIAYDEGAQELDPIAKIEYLHFGKIADATNRFFMAWNQRAGSILSTKERKEAGFTNETGEIVHLTAAMGTDEGDFEVPWHLAYKEAKELAGLYRALGFAILGEFQEGASSLSEKERPRYKAKIDYYLALADAYETSEKSAWLRADALLKNQNDGDTTKPVHIHTIERGYGRDALQRIPEASLRMPDRNHKEINRRGLETREAMVKMGIKFLADAGLSSESQATMQLTANSIFSVRHFMGAGMGMRFKAAGQVLPNEAEARLQGGGVDISADYAATEKRIPLIREMFEVIFREEMDKLSAGEMLELWVAPHELAHPVGITSTTNKRIDYDTMSTLVEEWKATVGGMLLRFGEPWWEQFIGTRLGSELPPVSMDDLKEQAYFQLALCGRYAAMREDPAAQPYMRMSMMIANTALENGLLQKKDNGWKIDISSNENVYLFFADLRKQFQELMTIYDTGTEEDLRPFLAKYLHTSEFLEHVFRKVDEHLGATNQPSVKELCQMAA